MFIVPKLTTAALLPIGGGVFSLEVLCPVVSSKLALSRLFLAANVCWRYRSFWKSSVSTVKSSWHHTSRSCCRGMI